MNHDRDDVIDDNLPARSFTAGPEDPAELRSPSSKDQLRKQLMEEVNAFLARGGQIQQLAPTLRSDGMPEIDHGDALT